MINRFFPAALAATMVIASLGSATIVHARSTGSSSSSKSSSSSSPRSQSYSSPPKSSSFGSSNSSSSFGSGRTNSRQQTTISNYGASNLGSGSNRMGNTRQTTTIVRQTRVVVPTLSRQAQSYRSSPGIVVVRDRAPVFNDYSALNSYILAQSFANQAQNDALRAELLSRSNQPPIYTQQRVQVPVSSQQQSEVIQQEEEGIDFGDVFYGALYFAMWGIIWIIVISAIYFLATTYGPKVLTWIEERKNKKDDF